MASETTGRGDHVTHLMDAFVDGELDDLERERVEAHVEGCPACGRALDSVLDLRDRAASLPKDVAPAGDLWPGVAARIQKTQKSFAWGRYAAAALIVLAAGGSWWMFPGRTPETASPGLVQQTEMGRPESDYARALQLMEAAVEGMKPLEPASQRVVKENLKILNQAIAEIQEAVERNPGNPVLRDLLSFVYEQKRQTLRQILGHAERARPGA